MWVLLLVIFGAVTADDTTSFIEKYDTQKECNDDKDYITTEMRKVYEHDGQRFELKCIYHGAKI